VVANNIRRSKEKNYGYDASAAPTATSAKPASSIR